MTARVPLAIATLVFQAAVLPIAVVAQADVVPDAVAPATRSNPLLSRKTATGAGFLFAATMLGDRELREEAQEHRGSTSNSLSRIGNSFGDWRYLVPALSGAYLTGELTGSGDLKRVALHASAAALLATGVTSTLKYSIGRSRPVVAGDPDQFRPFSGWNSFPSGHTAVAFAIATSIADETGDGWSDVALYGAATLTAMARVNDDRHWTSDVLIGGLVGHLSAKWVARRMGPIRVAPTGVAANIEF